MSPLSKKRQHAQALLSKRDAIEFQRVGRVHRKRKSMDEQMEISSQKQRNVEHRLDIVQCSIPYNRGISI